jgi:hypothetical protein
MPGLFIPGCIDYNRRRIGYGRDAIGLAWNISNLSRSMRTCRRRARRGLSSFDQAPRLWG